MKFILGLYEDRFGRAGDIIFERWGDWARINEVRDGQVIVFSVKRDGFDDFENDPCHIGQVEMQYPKPLGFYSYPNIEFGGYVTEYGYHDTPDGAPPKDEPGKDPGYAYVPPKQWLNRLAIVRLTTLGDKQFAEWHEEWLEEND